MQLMGIIVIDNKEKLREFVPPLDAEILTIKCNFENEIMKNICYSHVSTRMVMQGYTTFRIAEGILGDSSEFEIYPNIYPLPVTLYGKGNIIKCELGGDKEISEYINKLKTDGILILHGKGNCICNAVLSYYFSSSNDIVIMTDIVDNKIMGVLSKSLKKVIIFY